MSLCVLIDQKCFTKTRPLEEKWPSGLHQTDLVEIVDVSVGLGVH